MIGQERLTCSTPQQNRTDEDILTQSVEAKELTKRIAEAQSFEGLVSVFQWMETDHYSEDDEIE
jgi:hypothetical protein